LHACRSTLEDPRAGPGDPELITVKGLKALRQADVVVYDRLVSPSLLNECKPGCERIYVGKGYGEAEVQEGINELLVRKAWEGKTVVRLKGGDPYVFGRGEEECIFVMEMGIDCEVMGTELEFVIMVIAVSCVKLLSAHNSTQHTSRKHKV